MPTGGDRESPRLGERSGGGDPDAQAGEGARADPDGDALDPLPAAGRIDAPLDLRQEDLGVARPAVGSRVHPGLADDLAVGSHPDDGVGGRAIDTDHDHD